MLTIIICLLYCQGKKLTFRLEIMPIDAKKLTKSGNLDNCLQFLKKPVNLKGLRREKRYLCGRILRAYFSRRLSATQKALKGHEPCVHGLLK
jgi:uncharacterized protein VirK/YbjX